MNETLYLLIYKINFEVIIYKGSTIGPIVRYFKVKQKEEEEPTMSAKSANRLIDHLMSGLEDIIGIAGKHSIREKYPEF